MMSSENLIISPLAVANSLALLTQVTNGPTYDEIKKALHLKSNKSVIANQFHQLDSAIKNDNYTISTVNQIYVQEKCEINAKFQQIANSKFMSGVENLNFGKLEDSVRVINKFIEEKTNKTVRDLIAPGILTENMGMLLVNAIHFDNNWLFPFKKELTHRGDFYISENETVQVEYMCFKSLNIFSPTANYKYLYDLNAAAVELYFGNTQFSMVIILPDNRIGLTELEAKLIDYDLEYLLSRLGNEKPHLTIPKFEIEFDIELNAMLQNVRFLSLLNENKYLN